MVKYLFKLPRLVQQAHRRVQPKCFIHLLRCVKCPGQRRRYCGRWRQRRSRLFVGPIGGQILPIGCCHDMSVTAW